MAGVPEVLGQIRESLIYYDGDEYRGTFKEDKKEGKGTYIKKASGTEHYGDFVNNK
jgi:hypothetical protein